MSMPNSRIPMEVKAMIWTMKRPRKTIKSLVILIMMLIIGPKVIVSINIIKSLIQ